ncbi:MAG TPA: hypothetical protein VJV78_25215 [Polyangiales bacterium]|nr:hypothetical protein [Polyangiales bacterium]
MLMTLPRSGVGGTQGIGRGVAGDLTVDQNFVYEARDGNIAKTPRTGGAEVLLLKQPSFSGPSTRIAAITSDAKFVYWLTRTSVMRVAK